MKKINKSTTKTSDSKEASKPEEKSISLQTWEKIANLPMETFGIIKTTRDFIKLDKDGIPPYVNLHPTRLHLEPKVSAVITSLENVLHALNNSKEKSKYCLEVADNGMLVIYKK